MYPKRIIILSDSFQGYGAEHILRWLGNTLNLQGYDVTFCSIFDTEKNLEINADAAYYQMCFPFRVFDLKYFLKGAYNLLKLCSEVKFDYVITFHTNPFLMALISKPFCRYKIIHSERDNPYNRDTLATKFKMWLYRFADKIVFQTEGARNFFPKIVQKKSVIIYNPVEQFNYQWDANNCNRTIVNVGRLNIRFKRQDLLLEAFKIVHDSHPDYSLVFYGDGNDCKLLQQQIDNYNLGDCATLKGKTDNVINSILYDNIFVLASDSEGLPNALMEAMAIGMPVISTDCEPGGAKALIQNGVNGIIVPRGDADRLAEAIQFFIENKEKAAQYGLSARQSMKSFAPSIIICKWNELLIK